MFKEENFRDMLECAPDALVIINSRGEIVLVNAQTENLFRYKRSELLGKPIEILIPGRFHESHVQYRNGFFSTPKTRPMGHPGINLTGVRKNGEEFRVEISLSPVKVSENQVLIVSAIRDITEAVRIEEKLRTSEGLFEKIFESTLNGIVLLEAVRNSQGKITDFEYRLVNKRAEILLKKKKQELIGKTMQNEFPQTVATGLFDLYTKVVEKDLKETRELWYEDDRLRAWFKISVARLHDGLIVSFDDITERKEAQLKLMNLNTDLERRVKERTRELSSAIERLKGINEKLDKYAYIISHDLKAPLSNIEGLSNYLRDEYGGGKVLDEEGEEMFAMIESKVKDMKMIIDNVLRSAKEELKNKEVVHLYTITQEIIETLDPPEHFHFFVQHNMPVVKYPRSSIIQIMQNLLSNAIKYMDKEQPLITVSCRENTDSYVICITDNGAGIQKEKLGDIFNIFEVAHSDHTIESHGIGLSIVKQLVEENGGKIWAESEVGAETQFHFTIPKN